MSAPTSQSPRVSLISMEVKVGFALMQRVGVWSVAHNERQGGCSASGEDQFLGVEHGCDVIGTKLEDVEDSLSDRTGMARPALHQSVCAPHPDRRRTAIHIAVQSYIDQCLRCQACTNMPRVQILSMPHSAPAGSNAPLHVPRPDALRCRKAATSRGIESDKAYVGSNPTHIYRITINDPDIAGTKATILCCGLRRGRPIERQEARGHPAGSQVRPNLRPLSLVTKQLDTRAFNQNAHDPIRRGRPVPLIDSCPCHIDVSGTSRLRCGRRWRSVRCGLR